MSSQCGGNARSFCTNTTSAETPSVTAHPYLETFTTVWADGRQRRLAVLAAAVAAPETARGEAQAAGLTAVEIVVDTPNGWLKVRVIGTRSNRSGIGARIHLRLRDGDSERSVYRFVSSGGSFGANPLMQHLCSNLRT